jgi:putative ABC transport system substrate-binding protein
MNNRRTLLFALSARTLAWRLPTRAIVFAAITTVLLTPSAMAQTVHKIPRLAILEIAPQKASEAFFQGLKDLGYVEGKNITIERRYAEGHADRLPALAAELVRGKPDVILTPTTPAAHAAKDATNSIPIVIVHASDPVGSGFAASLNRPGGNVTGTSNIQTELDAKRVEMLKEVFPKIARVGVVHAGDRLALLQMAAVQKGGRALGVDVVSMEASQPEHYRQEIARARSRSIDALLITSNAQNSEHRRLIVELTAEHRIPAIYPNVRWPDVGGLMGFGTEDRALYYRAATYVDKIIKGAKPGDLPIEQPTRFELAINLKTAKALGITIPKTLLVRADRVIE